jgi:hypothetical protein
MRPPTTIRNSGLAPSQVGTRILGCPGRPARSEHARDFGGSYLLALTSGDAPRVPPRCLSGGRNGWTSGVVLDQLALHHFRCDLCLEHHGPTLGQAGFTVFVVVLFCILSPSQRRVGMLRVEDIALGGALSLFVASLQRFGETFA